MSANVESMFYVEDMPWHKTGTELTEPPDSQTAIIAAGLNWNVEKTKIYSQNGFEIKNYFGIMRTDNKKILGVVKNNYQPLQNRDAFNFFDPLINSKFLQYETAGALGEGEIVWILAKIRNDGSFYVHQDDEISKYLLLSNSHDGQSAVNIKFTPIRVVCQNTLSMALNSGKTTNIKHLPGMKDKLEDIQAVVTDICKIYSHIEVRFNEMAECKLENNAVQSYFNKIYPVMDLKLGMTEEQIKKRDFIIKIHQQLMNYFENGIGVKEFHIDGTLWAAYNAVTQFIDHPDSYKLGDNKLLKRIWFGDGEILKKKAYNIAVGWLKTG